MTQRPPIPIVPGRAQPLRSILSDDEDQSTQKTPQTGKILDRDIHEALFSKLSMTQKRARVSVNRLMKELMIVRQWIEESTHESLPNIPNELFVTLRDGVILCKLINSAFPEHHLQKIVHISNAKITQDYRHMDNILKFLEAAGQIIPQSSLFDPIDLYERKNLKKVCFCLFHLYTVAHHGISPADEVYRQENPEAFQSTPSQLSTQPPTAITEVISEPQVPSEANKNWLAGDVSELLMIYCVVITFFFYKWLDLWDENNKWTL